MTTIETGFTTHQLESPPAKCPAADGPGLSPSVSHRGARVEFPRDQGIHELIEEQVRRTPDTTALVVGPRSFTYRELDERANRLAGMLQNLGIGPDVPVGVCLDRSAEMMVGLLGILKSGGCYVPLDPAFPAERLAFMLADAQPPVVLTQTARRDGFGFENSTAKMLCVDGVNGEWRLLNSESAPPSETGSHKPDTFRNSPAGTRDSPLAYIIYTSGSTGQPKGVMVTHRNVANFFAAMDRVLGPEPGVWLAVTSISFDISVLELFWTLARGLTVVLRSEETGTKAAPEPSIPEQILQRGVTHFQCTPSLAGSLIRTPSAHQAIGQLKKLLVGGEAMPAALARQLREIPGPELFNMYGPTETTVWSAAHSVQDVPDNVPIGRPIANTDIYIMDEQSQPVATGEAGEIFIGGEGVARGYLHRPVLTAEKFIPNPFGVQPSGGPDRVNAGLQTGARLYRTGDVGRYRADGAIEFLGRVDHQVKLAGHRIELGEIEAALRKHPEVRECVVHVREIAPDDKRLVAWFVPAHASKTLPTALRRFLETKLPRHMIPSVFVPLEKMPLTPNGKTDRRALPDPGELRPELETPHVSPRMQIEETLAGIWRGVLRLEQIGVHDNFFDLGGNSLLLMEIHAKVCASLGVAPSVVEFFEYPTVSALAEFLSRDKKPLSDIQQRAARQNAAFARRPMRAVAS